VSEAALITGASSGIGEEFARALSGRGHEVVLVARRTDRLERLAGELPGRAHPLACDLATEAGSLRERVEGLGVEVGLLVNNAGFGTYGRFLDADPEAEVGQVRVNCEAVVAVTHAFLPAMVRRGRGGVITVASTAGMQPLPYQAVYAATKAFARSFSDALAVELRGTGVRVLTVNPGPVSTEFQEVAGYRSSEDTFGVPGRVGPRQVVAEALAAYDRGRASVIPGRTIRWFMRVNQPAPRAVKLRVSERMYRPR
jgi:short-subunit dehydrogenase